MLEQFGGRQIGRGERKVRRLFSFSHGERNVINDGKNQTIPLRPHSLVLFARARRNGHADRTNGIVMNSLTFFVTRRQRIFSTTSNISSSSRRSVVSFCSLCFWRCLTCTFSLKCIGRKSSPGCRIPPIRLQALLTICKS